MEDFGFLEDFCCSHRLPSKNYCISKVDKYIFTLISYMDRLLSCNFYFLSLYNSGLHFLLKPKKILSAVLDRMFYCNLTTETTHSQLKLKKFHCVKRMHQKPASWNIFLQIPIVEGEHKLSTLTFLSLEAISYARMLQNLKISCLLLNFLNLNKF